MKKAPSIHRIYSLQRMLDSRESLVQLEGGGMWHPARPLGFFSITHRLRCAWLVFTGKADALIWPEDE
jgi:hypothetical protein